jgi:hypothetical protein
MPCQSAVVFTLNSPASLLQLYSLVIRPQSKQDLWPAAQPMAPVVAAELIREVGLKCIGFNGVPRTINTLGAFTAGLDPSVAQALHKKPQRALNPANISAVNSRGAELWTSVYHPLHEKLRAKLAASHPDLPVFIIAAEYGALFSDPPGLGSDGAGYKIGRVLTSIVAVASLRAQSGNAPQVTSHLFGLRKAFVDGSHKAAEEEPVQGGEWLASDEGNIWILETVDKIVDKIGGGQGTTFAPGLKL